MTELNIYIKIFLLLLQTQTQIQFFQMNTKNLVTIMRSILEVGEEAQKQLDRDFNELKEKCRTLKDMHQNIVKSRIPVLKDKSSELENQIQVLEERLSLLKKSKSQCCCAEDERVEICDQRKAINHEIIGISLEIRSELNEAEKIIVERERVADKMKKILIEKDEIIRVTKRLI